jgi:RNA polymerase-associated protein
MNSFLNRRNSMVLVSGERCIDSHICRIVLHEKAVESDIHFLGPGDIDDLAELNPYAETPTLVDRDLVLYGVHVINEYLDERLPHPPLMPVDPIGRGRARLLMSRLERDWLRPVREGANARGRLPAATARGLRDGLLSVSMMFTEQPFMMGEDFSLVDCVMAPLLWRIPVFGVKLPRQAKPVEEYAGRLFQRTAFVAALSDAERRMR